MFNDLHVFNKYRCTWKCLNGVKNPAGGDCTHVQDLFNRFVVSGAVVRNDFVRRGLVPV